MGEATILSPEEVLAILVDGGSDDAVERLIASHEYLRAKLAATEVREADARRDHERAMKRADRAEAEGARLREAIALLEPAARIVISESGWSGSSGNWPLQEASVAAQKGLAALAASEGKQDPAVCPRCAALQRGAPATVWLEHASWCFAAPAERKDGGT